MKLKSLVFWLIAAALGVGVGLLIRDRKRLPVNLPPATWSLDQSIDEAASYIVRATDKNGRYTYQMAADGGVASSEYNIVRHAGAIYALADYQVQAKTPAARASAADATERAADRLVQTYIRPPAKHPDMLAVWSNPKEEGGTKWASKLGGTALGMVGLLGRGRALDGGIDLSTPQKLARFAVYMQKSDGDFNSKYTDQDGLILGSSLYYPGETILGLAMLYEADRDPTWLDAALRGVAARDVALRSMKELPPDHWLLIAIDRLLPLIGDAKAPPITRDKMLALAITIAESMMSDQALVHMRHPEIDGCYTNDGRTTPSATRLEGLLALEHGIRDDAKYEKVRGNIRRSVVNGMEFLRRSQITSGPRQGGFPPSVAPSDNSSAREDEGEDEKAARRGDVRIDYVQHALSAMMRFRQLCVADAAACVR